MEKILKVWFFPRGLPRFRAWAGVLAENLLGVLSAFGVANIEVTGVYSETLV
jgi:hypothetical protein